MQQRGTLPRRKPYPLLPLAAAILLCARASADRIVLAPSGAAIAPDGVRAQWLVPVQSQFGNMALLQYGTPEGIELEAERTDLLDARRHGYSFNLQYPLTIDVGGVPAISIGMRDLFGSGGEGRSVYAATTHSVLLPEWTHRIVRDLSVTGGAGTGAMDGLFIGMQARFAPGLSLSAELFRRRPDVGLGIRVGRYAQASLASLDGRILYGVTFTLIR